MSSDTPTRSVGPPGTREVTRAWHVLLLAGTFEVGYALAVGGSNGFTVLSWSVVAAAFFLLLCSRSALPAHHRRRHRVRRMGGHRHGRRGTARAVVFDEELTPAKAFWLAIIIIGVTWLRLADRPDASPGAGRR